jgi:hypothetical protein
VNSPSLEVFNVTACLGLVGQHQVKQEIEERRKRQGKK